MLRRTVAKGETVSEPNIETPRVEASLSAPEKGVADILSEAFQLYRKHWRSLLFTCALLFVPASFVNSCAVSAILGPTVSAHAFAEASAEQALKVEATGHALREAYAHHADAATITRLKEANRAALDEFGRITVDAAGGVREFGLFLLRMLGTMMTAFFLYGIIVPLTNGALTIAVADRVLGGNAEAREVWMLLFRRLRKLLTAVIPAAIFVALGIVMFVIPGLVLALFFAFVSPVVLIEGLGGREALRRSTDLVRSDWLRVALVVTTFGVIRALATMIAHLVVPRGAIFFDAFIADLITLVGMPIPVLGAVLLYFDVRRKHERFTENTLRAELAGLRQ
jgi:hypothetical protein